MWRKLIDWFGRLFKRPDAEDWTVYDQCAALKQGWGVFRGDDGRQEIWSMNDRPDRSAWLQVYRNGVRGNDPLSKKALEWIKRTNPVEYRCIERFALQKGLIESPVTDAVEE